MEIDHIIPKAVGGTDDEENLWLASRLCNTFKGIQTHGQDPVTNRNTS
nr:HNH endonuclease signature motif containing protein [Chlorogloeopsis fritschii]